MTGKIETFGVFLTLKTPPAVQFFYTFVYRPVLYGTMCVCGGERSGVCVGSGGEAEGGEQCTKSQKFLAEVLALQLS